MERNGNVEPEEVIKRNAEMLAAPLAAAERMLPRGAAISRQSTPLRR